MISLSALMTPARAEDVCSPATRHWLESTFSVRWGSTELGVEEVADLVTGADVVLSSWGTPHLDTTLLTAGRTPKTVAHAAGSVKRLVDLDAMAAGTTVFSAGERIALSVGEYCLGAILTLLRRLPQLDRALRDGGWKQPRLRGSELTGRTVGLVGASSTARALIRLLQPFAVDLLVFDPYLTAERAGALGVRRASLIEVMDADIISLHVPSTPETEGLIGADLIARIRPGTILVNSARAATLDGPALTEAILEGRILAALDVFQPEPPTLSAELRAAPNVLLTPHVAGDTIQGHADLSRFVMADVEAWLRDGTRGTSYVDPARLAVSA
ncbi:hydroxyacid dehydrogenase [Occultella glacieicola]|uniref:Hydroxyacid dehydrogenase n=1 Tax=Occultella glacieicola TaxID=2518684 RepID=A0ABY2EA66_9MICO|nr:hydroxyacid dehydrogenase [Occultella glacieicola]TDE98964.1 hydroxyacid dehydrogenase [Occultella glacieicola]